MNREAMIEAMAWAMCASGNLFQPDEDVWNDADQKLQKGWTIYLPDAKAALAAHEAELKRQGYVVVPEFQTESGEAAFWTF